jgi:hypothetical protein
MSQMTKGHIAPARSGNLRRISRELVAMITIPIGIHKRIHPRIILRLPTDCAGLLSLGIAHIAQNTPGFLG